MTARLGTELPEGRRRGAMALKRLSSAYRAVFTGTAMREDADIVTADLADFSGFYRVNGPEVPAEARAFTDGQRAVFGRIFRFIRATDEETRSIEEAARAEAIVDNQEGTL